jgi:hypothetical protein
MSCLGVVPEERGGVNKEGEGGWIRSMYSVSMYEHRTMKPVEIILERKGGGGWRRIMGAVNLTHIVGTYVNSTMNPRVQQIYTNKN